MVVKERQKIMHCPLVLNGKSESEEANMRKLRRGRLYSRFQASSRYRIHFCESTLERRLQRLVIKEPVHYHESARLFRSLMEQPRLTLMKRTSVRSGTVAETY